MKRPAGGRPHSCCRVGYSVSEDRSRPGSSEGSISPSSSTDAGRSLRRHQNLPARMVRNALGCRRHELADILGLEIRVALELVPRVVERELRDLVDLVAALEQAAGGLVAQVVKTQVLDSQDVARAGEGRTDASGLVGEDVCAASGLSLHD